MGIPFWPSIDDAEDAKKACRSAGGMSFFVALLTGFVVWLQTSNKINFASGFNHLAYIDAVLFSFIGIGLFRCSRIAAILGLLLYVIGKAVMMYQGMMQPHQVWLPILIALFFMRGVRGSFAYHSFRKQEMLEEAQQTVLTPAEGQAAEEAPKKNRKRLVVFGISLLVIAAVIAAAGFFIFKKNVFSSGPSVLTGNSSAVSSGETMVSGDEKIFHLKTGESVKGKVLREDETYYTVETFGGTQQYVIKEDILRQE